MSNVLMAIAVTAELTGTELSKNAMQAMEADLSEYPSDRVLVALNRCRKEIKGRLTLAEIISRIQSMDGRPTANEAWAIALDSFDEYKTVVTNQEIGEAMGCARTIYNAGDEVGARVAFRDAYERIVEHHRAESVPAKWFPSLGADVSGRDHPVRKAIEIGLLDKASYLPMLENKSDGAGIMALLEFKDEPEGLSEKGKQCIKKMKQLLKAKK